MQRQQLSRNNSKGSFASQMYTHSRNQSLNNSKEKTSARRAYCSNNFPSMDKLIEDVKITQIKQNKYTVHVQNIAAELQALRGLPLIRDQVFTIQLLLDTINKKISSDSMVLSRNTLLQNTARKNTVAESTLRKEQTSPIRHIQDANSIAYTKFSLKQIGGLPYQNSTMSYNVSSNLQTPKKHILLESETHREIENVNTEIQVLSKILKTKGLEQAPLSHKPLNKIDLSHRSCNESRTKLQAYTFRKEVNQKCKDNNSKDIVWHSREGKIKVTQSKFR